MNLQVWVDGVERSVSGVTENTTCTQLIYALAHATGQKGKFVLVESFRNTVSLNTALRRNIYAAKNYFEQE